jgi:hypothetical protein
MSSSTRSTRRRAEPGRGASRNSESRPLFYPRMSPRWLAAVMLSLALTGAVALGRAAPARAAHTQTTIIEDARVMVNPDTYLARFRALGAQTVRIILPWATIAPRWRAKRAPKFNDSDPAAYPSASWGPFDTVVRRARDYGLSIELTVTGGAPLWAEGPGLPPQGLNPYFAWKPDPARYEHFVHAVGRRYDGSFTPRGESTPLPAVRFWTIWNEPNFGEDLGPQAIAGSAIPDAPRMYRNLVAAGWTALHQTGHGDDRIVIGGFAAEGLVHRPSRRYPRGLPGNYGQTKPLKFIRALYCVDDSYRRLPGTYAHAVGCPTTAAGYARFRARNPGLFSASGVSDHPYTNGASPLGIPHNDSNYATFAQLGGLERTLDAANRVYGSHRRYSIYSDEFGFITHPPETAHYPSPSRAAYFLNWSEYLSWRNPRVASFAQYLLIDPTGRGTKSGFASGLLTAAGHPKATFYAFRVPVYMPRTHGRRGQPLEVWGDARPASAPSLSASGPYLNPIRPSVAIQLQAHGRGPFETVRTVRVTSGEGYFDIRQRFAVTGRVRLSFTYPDAEALLPDNVAGDTVYSRAVQVVVR